MSPARRWARGTTTSPAALLLCAACIAALVWWQWPLLTNEDARTDVVLVTDKFLSSTERPVTYRIHEDGRSLRWDDDQTTSWCDAAAAVGEATSRYDPVSVVLSFADSDGCGVEAVDAAVRAAQGHRVIVVVQPGGSGVEHSAAAAGATVIDPGRLIGDVVAATAMPCQWWETCPATGTVAVRGPDGSLTEEGGDRVARMIVAALG